MIRAKFLVLTLLPLMSCTSSTAGGESQLASDAVHIEPTPFTDVRFTDQFWAARLETNRTVTIPHVFRRCEEEGRMENFAIAGGLRASPSTTRTSTRRSRGLPTRSCSIRTRSSRRTSTS